MHWFQKKENLNSDDKQTAGTEQGSDTSVKLERDAAYIILPTHSVPMNGALF